jgi:ketosteroid isomerase-like protein
MKLHALVLLAILAVVGRVASAQEVSAEPGLEQEIRSLDLAHAEAIFNGDAKALDVLMDDDVTVNHPTNRIVKEKQQLLALIRQGVIRYTAFDRHPEAFLFFKDMVVVMGRETVVPAPGAPNAGKTLQRRYTNVWMRRDGQWRLTVRHANNVCPETGVAGV